MGWWSHRLGFSSPSSGYSPMKGGAVRTTEGPGSGGRKLPVRFHILKPFTGVFQLSPLQKAEIRWWWNSSCLAAKYSFLSMTEFFLGMLACLVAVMSNWWTWVAIPWTLAHQTSLPLNSPGKNAGEGCQARLQGIFPTEGSNRGLPRCRRILYRVSHQGNPLTW